MSARWHGLNVGICSGCDGVGFSDFLFSYLFDLDGSVEVMLHKCEQMDIDSL